MTKLLEHALEVARKLPPDLQDDMARLMLAFTSGDQASVILSDEEEASLLESEAQADRREFATDEQVRAVWAKYGL